MSTSKRVDQILKSMTEGKRHREKEQQPTPAPPSTEDRLLQAIMAKMSTRKTDVEERRRPVGDILRPTGLGGRAPTSLPTRFEKKLSDKIPKFKRPLDPVPDEKLRDIAVLFAGKNKGYNTNIEIEASLGLFEGTSFRPGLRSHSDFVNLREFFSGCAFPKFRSHSTEDVIEIMKDSKGVIRRWYDAEDPSVDDYERKFRYTKTAVALYEYGARITRSNEEAADPPTEWRPHLRRQRRRTTFYTTDHKSPFIGFVVEMTIVQEEEIAWKKNDRTGKYEEHPGRSYIKYEVEIENKDRRVEPKGGQGAAMTITRDFVDLVKFVYTASVANGTRNPDVTLLMSERAYAVKLHNTLFEGDMRAVGNKWSSKGKYGLYSNTYWNKPRDVKFRDLQPTESKKGKMVFYLAHASPTVKLNGKRFFLLCAKEACYMMMPPYTIVKFGTLKDEAFDGTYLDGEFVSRFDENCNIVEYTFHAFDIFFYKGRDVRQENFVTRLSMVKEAIQHVDPYANQKITAKHFYTEGSIYDRLQAAADEYNLMLKADPESVDGIIIQPSHWYRNNDTLKWKPASQLTIDFKFFPAEKEDVDDPSLPRINSDNFGNAFLLGVKNRGNVELFHPTVPIEYDGDVILTDEEMKKAPWANVIVECTWSESRRMFLPIRVRDDRTHPNNSDTAYDVWRDIHSPITLQTLTGRDLVIMRKLHNRIKDTILTKYLPKGGTIIDIGSGRGGDIRKWHKIGLKRVYAIEPNAENAAEFKRRLNDFRGDNIPDIHLLNFGAEETAKIKQHINNDNIDAIVSFFSLTFFGKSKETWDKLFKTLDIVPEGGYFIGAVMDGVRVHNLLAQEREWRSYTPDELFRQVTSIRKQVEVMLEQDPFKNQVRILEMEKEAARLEKEAKRRETEGYEPLQPDEAVTYDCDAFKIEQTSDFDMEQPDRNEIEVTIYDRTSMVKDQIEWLINYEILRRRLNSMGFDEITEFFVDGNDAKFLPKDAFTFSALNRIFVFRRAPRPTAYKAPEDPGQIRNFRNDYDENMILKGVRKQNGGFVHAILEALDDKYRKKSGSEQDKYVLSVRKNLADKLTMKRFQKLHDGELSKRMAYQIKKKTDDDALKAAFEKFKQRLIDPEVQVSEVSLLELMAEKFDTAIYVVNLSDGSFDLSRYLSNKIQCQEILNHKNAIVIATENNLSFFLAGRKISDEEHVFVFKSTDPMIRKMYDQLCK